MVDVIRRRCVQDAYPTHKSNYLMIKELSAKKPEPAPWTHTAKKLALSNEPKATGINSFFDSGDYWGQRTSLNRLALFDMASSLKKLLPTKKPVASCQSIPGLQRVCLMRLTRTAQVCLAS